jgi:hypothetical protein
MIVIGADTHKRNHTLVAVDGQTGALRGQREIAASDAGSMEALRFAAGLQDSERCGRWRTAGMSPHGWKQR